jgi:predicted dehydrogenase
MSTGPCTPTRRQFLGTSAAVAAAVAAGIDQLRGEEEDREKEFTKDDRLVSLGIIGCGREGCFLMTQSLQIPNVRYVAACDIWPHRRSVAINICKNLTDEKQYVEPAQYTEYADFLNDAQKNGVEAVIVAVPDWKHAEVSNACLRAGYHVYCEKEMDKTIDGARQMVLTARETGKILQIGHQRHSNPYYKLAYKLIHQDKVCGRITHARGQFNRNMNGRWRDTNPEFDPTAWGYQTISHLRDWRLYKKHGGGWMADLGSHQVDVFNWMLDAPPHAVMGCGGIDYYLDESYETGPADKRVRHPYPNREWYDNVLCLFEYPDVAAGRGLVRIQYEVITTNMFDWFYEVFFGTEGTLFLSSDGGLIFREPGVQKLAWETEATKTSVIGLDGIQTGVGRTLKAGRRLRFLRYEDVGTRIRIEKSKTEHQQSLEDFIYALRTGIPGGCSPDDGFVTTVACLTASEAAENKTKIVFKPEEFVVA